MYYSIHNDRTHFAALGFDWKQIVAVFGDSMDTRFDVNQAPRSYAGSWNPEITVTFSNAGGLTGSAIPDIAEHQGRLFISAKAYDLLYPLLKNDGEFLPVTCADGNGYMFNPLRLAEELGALNEAHCVKNEWDEVEHIAFHEDKLTSVTAFRTEFDDYLSLFCNEKLKQAIEQHQLTGVTFNTNLGNPGGLATNGPH
ncbi:MAG: hypothetical protein CSH37_15365 [Thalassolituus sp.]|nr:MAG: hypothetical protein CSH37_15365 [Thalassolituus sp.]